MRVPDATILICTRDRPEELQALLTSIGASRFPDGQRPDVEIVVVENGPNRAGFDIADLSALAGFPVRVVHEPRPGVAYARNRALAERGRAPLVLMVDDDEVVTRGWLGSHLRHAGESTADVMTGPVLTRIPDGAPAWAIAMWRNVPRHETGTRQPSFLGGNVCFRSTIFDEVDTWFDERRPTATADDTSFGRRLVELGYTIEWNDLAIAWENVHEARLTRRWMVERYLSYGGFEAEFATERVGRIGALRTDGLSTTTNLLRGLGHAVRGLATREPEHEAAAIALTFESIGWFGGLLGLRVADYRRVTSREREAVGAT